MADFRPGEVRVYPVTYKSVPLGVIVLATAAHLHCRTTGHGSTSSCRVSGWR